MSPAAAAAALVDMLHLRGFVCAVEAHMIVRESVVMQTKRLWVVGSVVATTHVGG